MLVRLLPSSDSAHLARRVVTEALTDYGRGDLVDDATLVVSELVANAVMHARTPMDLSIEAAGHGIRVAVSDGSHILPRWTPASPTATSGRGLILVERLATRWGAEPHGGGKTVWAVLDAPTSNVEEATPEDLLAMWSDEPWPSHPAQATVEVTLEIDVATMLASRAHTEDLNRELQLILLSERWRPAPPPVLQMAGRLSSANEDFYTARWQILDQTLRAAKQGHARATLHLHLQPTDAAAASAWLAALDEADDLNNQGVLLLPPFPMQIVAFRKDYITHILTALNAASPHLPVADDQQNDKLNRPGMSGGFNL